MVPKPLPNARVSDSSYPPPRLRSSRSSPQLSDLGQASEFSDFQTFSKVMPSSSSISSDTMGLKSSSVQPSVICSPSPPFESLVSTSPYFSSLKVSEPTCIVGSEQVLKPESSSNSLVGDSSSPHPDTADKATPPTRHSLALRQALCLLASASRAGIESASLTPQKMTPKSLPSTPSSLSSSVSTVLTSTKATTSVTMTLITPTTSPKSAFLLDRSSLHKRILLPRVDSPASPQHSSRSNVQSPTSSTPIELGCIDRSSLMEPKSTSLSVSSPPLTLANSHSCSVISHLPLTAGSVAHVDLPSNSGLSQQHPQLEPQPAQLEQLQQSLSSPPPLLILPLKLLARHHSLSTQSLAFQTRELLAHLGVDHQLFDKAILDMCHFGEFIGAQSHMRVYIAPSTSEFADPILT
ncbi:unnamed protein product [Protopolystoma xenopodis]|uniref:Uncharacterized protein n=1 Tax=Protopolystoma xenopodis TaxID=117903 RepID=A0A3S5CB67_9PLAT|nr:unnamed protein product [Protopolystoma xenopodis]